MIKSIAPLSLAVGMILWNVPGANAQTDSTENQPQQAAAGKPSYVPDGLKRFNGLLIGKLIAKDVEKGEFTVKVDLVPRVWRNSKAKNPKSAIGKTLAVEGVFGKWLDVLLLVKPGDTLEFEARHDGGNRLTFPGELLRKSPPVKPEDYPEPPKDFRGFQGVVAGKVVKKDNQMGDLTLKVLRVQEVFQQSKAVKPESAVGKPIMIAGIYGKMREPFLKVKVGDTVRAAMLHRSPQSDHFSLGSLLQKLSDREGEGTEGKTNSSFPAGMRGFRGIMIGTLVSKDAEKGVLVFKAEKVKRVWRRNKATDLKSCQGKTFTVQGISGKFLDVLLLLKEGDRLEVEAFHNRGEQLDFPGEWLKKIE